MKQRIIRKDLEGLTEEQKIRLNELWIPSVYDAAVARVIKNVATDEYDEYAFVIGGISVYGTSIYLTDIIAGKAGFQSQTSAAETGTETDMPPVEDPALSIKVDPFFGESYPTFGSREDLTAASESVGEALTAENGELEDEDEEEQKDQEEEFPEEDLEDNYQLPASFIKGDCTPLLTIGNMIEILKNNNYGNFDFFLSASTYDIGCELGKGDSSWGNNSGWEPAELCDVLWESVKELL